MKRDLQASWEVGANMLLPLYSQEELLEAFNKLASSVIMAAGGTDAIDPNDCLSPQELLDEARELLENRGIASGAKDVDAPSKIQLVDAYYIGQRVIVNGEIGTVEVNKSPSIKGCHWVFMPSRGFASEYANSNIRPLPNGQL